jgi:heat-inducible transcriptional repressor
VEAHVPLDIRKQQVLKAVVADFTDTGIPVGSQALAARHLLSWSAATIRNELASLVDIGYLLQPHTSAGRIPSDRGYRYFVDFLMEEEAVSPAVRRQVDPLFPEHPVGVEELLETAAQVLALITDALSIVTGPQTLGAVVKHLDLVSLDDRHVLLILLLEGNLLRQQVIKLSSAADQTRLSALAAQLNSALQGSSSQAVSDIDWGDEPANPLRDEVVSHIVAVMQAADLRQDTVVLHDGVRNLLHQPEFGDVEQLEQVLAVVEEERALGQVLTSFDVDRGVQVIIGAENSVEQLRACSLVLTTYRAGETRRGTISVLGPTRMRYPQVAPRLRYVSQRVGQAMDRLLS